MPRIAIVTRALAPYHRALQEAFAASLGEGSELRLFYPADVGSVFSHESTLPRGPNIQCEWIESFGLSGDATRFLVKWRSESFGTQLPSLDLWRKLRAFDPHLTWVHELSPYTLAGMMMSKWLGKPVVMSSEVGSRNRHLFPHSVRLWHQGWGQFADGVIACSPAAREPLGGRGKPVVEAYHAADSRHWLPSDHGSRANGPVTFIFTGRLIERKGIDLLMRAARELRIRKPDGWRVILAGSDPDDWAKNQVMKYELSDRVQFTGHLESDQLRAEMSRADVFVLPSRADTYAAVVHEAACLGLPLLISRHAGAADALVSEGENGFVIDPEVTSDFAEKMERLCDTNLRRRMATGSRQIAESHSAHIRGPAVREWMREHFSV